ncbi:RICIN domain-containing protein [Fibrella forsythiae]|uniref:RICIN domain-containing protein n=1 Tax=Fibrella forsythiae TaxID=2817061 RepID=A0ABS3JJI9_9BACT|nr:RICIN domain-containing protein [Fibrella forsythiae]MBO0950169.1 RICIN domain-containing protein [Fibrella forsythiae]
MFTYILRRHAAYYTLFSGLLLCLGGLTATTSLAANLSQPGSVSTIEPNKCYRLVSRLSGKVLSVENNSPNDGAQLRQTTDANQLAQGWQFTADGSYYRISVLHNQKGIQVRSSATADDALLEQWTYWGGSYQQWTVQRNAEGYYSFVNRNSGKAITVRNASMAEGGEISQQTVGTGQQQQWSVEERSCTAAPANRPPVVVASSTPLTGTSPLSVTFTGNKSSDPDGDPITYQWDFGDGTFSTEANPVKVFTIRPGAQGVPQRSYSVKLTVSDNRGGIATSQTFVVSLNSTAPTVQITNPVNNAKYALDKATSYTFAATVTNASSSLTYLWQVKLRHNNSEQLVSTTSGANPVVEISPAGCDGDTYYYLVGLKVTDATGATAQDSVKIYPDCTSPKLTVTGLTATTASSGNSSRVLLRWTNPTVSFDDVLVVGKVGSGFTEIPLDINYVANASFTGNGSDLYGGKVLYQGTGTSLLVTELTAGQRYYFRVYARKGRGWSGGVEVSIVPTAANRPPVVVATSTSLTGTSPLSVTFTGNKSSDPDGNPITYQWDFGDGSFSTEANPVKVFTIRPGAQGIPQSSYSVRLTVSDDRGGIAISPILLVSLSSPSAAIEPGKCYRIQPRGSGLALNVPAGSGSDGTKLQLNTDAGQPWQKWQFTADGSYYRISVQHNQKGIQVRNGSTADDALLEQWTYWGGNYQQWTAQRNAEGYYSFISRNSGKAITVRNASAVEGAEISQQTLSTGQIQQWGLTETTCPTGGRIAVAEPGTTFSLWPNPARDHVMIDLSPARGQSVGLQLNDLLGRPLQQTQLDSAPTEPYRVNTGQLPNGLYLLQVAPSGQSPTTLRLLIQR